MYCPAPAAGVILGNGENSGEGKKGEHGENDDEVDQLRDAFLASPLGVASDLGARTEGFPPHGPKAWIEREVGSLS